MIQKQVQAKRPKLFRMTTKRKIALSDFKGSLRSHIELKNGFSRDMIEYASKLTEAEKTARIEKINQEVSELKEACDVILTVTNHHQPYLLHCWFMEERAWENEWDIPLEVFERGIQTAIAFAEDFKARTNNPASYYDEPIQVLQEMLAFRCAGEEKLVKSS